jgi:hypothetical protein
MNMRCSIINTPETADLIYIGPCTKIILILKKKLHLFFRPDSNSTIMPHTTMIEISS